MELKRHTMDSTALAPDQTASKVNASTVKAEGSALHKKSAVKAKAKTPSSVPKGKLKNKEFESQLAKLQAELVEMQLWVQHKGLKVVVVFEGRDAAGKGGVIKRITERVSPRVFRLVALPAPTEREKSQMYIQRYIPHLPAAGTTGPASRESWASAASKKRNDFSRCARFGSALSSKTGSS